jgi:hypothetical protein
MVAPVEIRSMERKSYLVNISPRNCTASIELKTIVKDEVELRVI